MDILIATKNNGKLNEFKKLFANLPFTFHSLNEFPNLGEVKEDGLTLMENALIKAKYYYEKTNMSVISDDTGLFIKALDDKPGIYTARYSGGTDLDNRHKVLKEMKGIIDRSCYFSTNLVFYDGKNILTAAGFLNGEIASSEIGEHGFGYDSIFYVKEKGKTLAELSDDEKNSLSHRYLATKSLIQKLKLYFGLMKPQNLIDEYFPHNLGFELLKGGMSNDTYLIKMEDGFKVFRIAGFSSEIFVDRNIERKALNLVKNHSHFIDQVRYFENGMLETVFIEAKDANQLNRFKTLCELHQLPFAHLYLPFKRFNYYERLNKIFNVELEPAFYELKTQLEKYQPILEMRPKVFCHNDCQLSNFIGDTLIDFEFCGLNDKLFDYACFGNNDINLSYEMVRMDDEIIDKEEAIKIIDLWYSLQALSWYLVALFKDRIGFSESQGLDFKAIGLMFFNKAQTLLQNLHSKN